MSTDTVNKIMLIALLIVGAFMFFTSGENAVTAAEVAHFLGLN